MRHHRIDVIPGDGIGREVVPAALRLLDRIGHAFGFELDQVVHPWGCEYYLEHGRMMPEDGLDFLRKSRAISLGAVGFPAVPDHVSLWGLLIPIRRGFREYVNYRPVRTFPAITGPLRSELSQGVDIAIVRENSEGEYSEIGGRFNVGTEDELALQESIFTRRGVDRLLRFGFDLATVRRQKLTSATKSNGIVHTMPFWDHIVEETSVDYPDVKVEKMHVDALCAALVLQPRAFDVIVGSNLFGDIPSDLAAAIVGSIGIAPSANIDPTGVFPSMFEPVHGSAPDIVGREIADPIGQVWSGALMLRHIGENDAAEAVELAIEWLLTSSEVRTPDLGGNASTTEVVEELARIVESGQ
jgi:tartrate dehydrogenase/decarboxylase / D-malate dehydrogenase